MKQIPYLCNDKREYIARIHEFKASLAGMPGYKCILATIYVDSYLKKYAPEMIVELKTILPDAKIIGGTVSANITAGVINMYGISVTFSVFFESEVEVIPIEWDDAKSRDMGKKLLYHVRQLYQPVAIQMITAGYNLNTLPFFEEISNIPEDIAIWGGVVDDGTISDPGFVFSTNRIIEKGMIVAIFKGRSLFVNVCNSSGWQPLGRRMKVTGLADNNSTITELDGGITIRSVYERYLGVEWNETFLDEAVVFPVCVNRDGITLNRMPRALTADGGLNYGADFQLGERVQLCYGNPTVVIQGTYAMQYDMVRFQPEGIFAVSCWARQVLLNKDVNQELEVCRNCAPSTGIYALGEYVRAINGKIHLNNMFLNIIGMREGGADNLVPDAENYFRHNVQFENKGNSVLSHMLHFVQAVSDELEVYNGKLKQIADTDKLTGLYNRSALERIMDEEIYRAREKAQMLSILLIDFDNFKNINDKFGHLIGDAALMNLAKILKDSIKDSDYPCRWGGDEFMVILRGASGEVGLKVGERIRSAVENSSVEKSMIDGALLRMSVSIGVATLRYSDSRDTLFKRADDALYVAKYQFNKNNVQIVR